MKTVNLLLDLKILTNNDLLVIQNLIDLDPCYKGGVAPWKRTFLRRILKHYFTTQDILLKYYRYLHKF